MPNQDPTQPGTPPPELHGLDPGELLARGLHTVKASANSGPWEPPTPEDLARLLPQYLIESLLGRGGMGAVYQGVQVALDRPVAIKLLPAEIAADGDFIARFQREARTLAKLQHSGIVTVYDFGQTSEGHLYFVMEYVDGTDLQRILKGPGLKPEQAFELIAQICDALYYAHRQGVIHRDIKPANILLTKDGRAKVADFGLARPIAEDSGGLTQTNMVMGTPDYMAPETRTSATHGDHRADIFALGVMLYEMLTGHRPQGAFQPPSHRVQVDVRIDEVVLKALQQEPDRRYQQASEMKVDVDRIRTTPPAPAKSAGSPWRIAALVAVGLLTLLVLGLAIPALLRSLAQRSTVADSSPAPAAPITATKDAPFVNSLGMKFVPVPGTDLLMCIHETRRKDYAAYADAVPSVDATWKNPMVEDKLLIQGDEHPVVEVSWEDATAFCVWLGKKEGRTYRLPTEREWNLAVAFDVNDPGTLSDTDLKKVLGPKLPWQYPWGTRDEKDAPKYGNYSGKGDGYEGTAPVMSFLPNRLGIYDLGGNAWEWCEENGATRVLRGCGYLNYGGYRWSGTRVSRDPGFRSPLPPLDDYSRGVIPGFRCLLVPTPSERAAKVGEQKPAPAITPATASRSGDPNVDQIVEWVFKYGGEVTARQGGDIVTAKDPSQIPAGKFDVIGITVRGNGVTDEEFAHLGSVPTLQRIELRGMSKITSLKPLAGLTQLRYLSLRYNSGLVENEVAHLGGLADLQLLSLRLPDATGESFRHFAGLKKLTSLFLYEGKLTEAGAKTLGSLPFLTLLSLNHCIFQDNQKVLVPIGQMPKLKNLELTQDDISAESFTSLAGLNKLESLNLSDSRIDNAGFALLTGSRGTLKVLNVDMHANVSDDGIRAIVANFPNLEEINLSMGSTCTGASIRELAKLPQLKRMSCWVMNGLKPDDYSLFADLPAIERLSIDGTTINDEALQAFTKCDRLTDLVLTNNAITDAGLKALKNLRPLDKLNVSSTKITAAGLADFQKARPEVHVFSSLDVAPAGAVLPSQGASPSGVAEAKKRLVEARAHLKAGDLAETRKLVEAALATAPGELTTQAEAALILAEAQAPERAAALAQEFVAQAEAEHPQFAAITELRVKLAPALKQYEQHLRTAAELVGKGDDAGEIRELKAALALVPDGKQAADKLAANPLHVGRALPGRKFANELGHTFVPVDGLPNVLFSIWETRVKDFEQFVKETGYDMSQPRSQTDKTLTWQKPGFEQTGDHPVVMVGREDAEFFCRWLTDKERAAGRLLPGQVYRLPTDREWSAAMGVLNLPGDFPKDRQFPKDVFTWPKDTQPARNVENLNWKNDDFPNTAPVGSGKPNRFGIYDLLGNVSEFCADFWDFHQPYSFVRGSSFSGGQIVGLERSNDGDGNREFGRPYCGFRCVLDLKTEPQRQMQIAFEQGLQKFCDAAATQDVPTRRRARAVINDEMVLLDLSRVNWSSEKTLSYFADLPVTHLYAEGGNMSGAMQVTKKWPLRVLSLRTLLGVKEDFLESFRGLPLEWVNLTLNTNGSGFRTQKSLEAFRGMKLKGLWLWSFTNLESLEPLRGMPLESLSLSVDTARVDLSPVKDAPLRDVQLSKQATLEDIFQACEWWGGKASIVVPVDAVLTTALREPVLAGDAARVQKLLADTEGRMKAIPYFQAKPSELTTIAFREQLRFAPAAAKWRSGDRAAFDGLVKTFNGHTYLSVPWGLNYDDSKAVAEKLGAHLVTITTPEESAFINQLIETKKLRGGTLGLERTGQGRMAWKWVTGEPLDFQNWGPISGTAGDRAYLTNEAGKWVWYHGGKADQGPFIIEWDTSTPQPPPAAAR